MTPEALDARFTRATPKPRRRQRAYCVAIAAGLLLLGAAGGGLWWELFRDRQPLIEGEIDEAALSAPTALCAGGRHTDCRPVRQVERLLHASDLSVVGAEPTSGGNQGVIALAVEVRDASAEAVRIKVKWRARESASMFNHPANELAAYALQRMLLDPADYVIPPIAARCIDLEVYREWVSAQASGGPDHDCVLGYMSYWIGESLTMPDARRAGALPMPEEGADEDDPMLYDAARFERDAVYRRNVSVLNLILYLTGNVDAHAGQFVLYTDPWHVFVVDSSVSFGAIANPRMLLAQDLSEMLVPALPSDVLSRLRSITRDDLDALRVQQELEIRDRTLVPVDPGRPIAGSEPVRRDGRRLQIGLTAPQVDEVWTRLQLVRDMDTFEDDR